MAGAIKQAAVSRPKGDHKAGIYSIDGKSVGTVELNAEIFGRNDIKSSLIHQAAVAILGNSRNTVASTKDRGEVRGGGKKPWKQKGTGRARAGSIRSPLWRGGGVTFGPTAARNFSKKINKIDRKLAVLAALSDRVRGGNLIVVEKLEVEPKTKEATRLIAILAGKFKDRGDGILFLTADKNDNLVRAVRNLPSASVRQASDFSLLDLLKNENIAVEKEALGKLEQNLLILRNRK